VEGVMTAGIIYMLSFLDRNGSHYLEKSLAPLWKLTYYSGLFFDWCAKIPHQSWKSVTAHYIVIAFGMTVYLQQLVLSCLQIMMAITNTESSLQRIIVRIISASNQPIIIVTWLYYLLGREKLWAFFRDWKQFEEQGSTRLDEAKIKRVCIIVYFFYFTCGIGFFLLSAPFFVTGEFLLENEFILEHYPNILDIFFVEIWLRFSTLLSVFLTCTIFVPLVDIVPVLVYYNISKMINAIEVELESLFLRRFNREGTVAIKYEAIQFIRSRFENLRVLLTRTDHLFGPILLLNHGIIFVVLCSTVFSLLNMVRQPHEREYLPIFVMTFLLAPSRLLFSFVMISKVHKAAGSLLSTVACISARPWRPVPIPFSSDCVIQSFMHRLQNTKLAATPSDLYEIRPSILLTLLGLIVSYTIILLQSNIPNRF